MPKKTDPLAKLPRGKWVTLSAGLPDVPLLMGSRTPTGRVSAPAVPAVIRGSSVTVAEVNPTLSVAPTVAIPQARPVVVDSI